MRFTWVLLAQSLLAACFFAGVVVLSAPMPTSWATPRRTFSVSDRLEMFGEQVRARLLDHFKRAGVPYPPKEVAYLSFKSERILELYARASNSLPWSFVTSYPILAASGRAGPKLREGDLQVPEGVYRASFLNPNSRFHLSIRLDYPNRFDRRMAAREGRSNLGGDIMIHGNAVSVGCIAIGDSAAEELFVLAALAGRHNVKILVSPVDFRVGRTVSEARALPWIESLYDSIRSELRQFSPLGSSPSAAPRNGMMCAFP